ncbi:MAG: T9SS type A sorting domain-containing protein, partial [Saprospiraceae bacterium]|nr:T9SS type A sorting domain-containing protein [Saprospiraceae bacterium]
DLIHLRKLILHVDREFRNNTSWRFIKADYTFPDPSDPWKEDFPEILNLNDLEKDMMTGDFIGVKIGDVNYSAIGYVRNAQGTFAFDLEETSMQTGGMYELTFRASDLDKLQGYQMALQWDTDAVELSDIRYALAQEEHFGFRYLDEGVLLNSWDGEASADEELFTLVFQANADVRLSEVLKVQSRYLQSEAYGLNGETLDIDLTFGGLAVEKRFHLYQNAPNPFSNETVIGFELPETASVTLTVFDASGRVLYLLNGDYAGGYNAVTINRDNLPASGVLYYRLETGDHAAMRKMIILE